MNEEITEDYIRGYRDGLISGNGRANALLHMVRMYVEERIAETTQPESIKEQK
jgi:hypothetical protein